MISLRNKHGMPTTENGNGVINIGLIKREQHFMMVCPHGMMRIRFLVIKDWYQQQPLLDFWTDEIRKILQDHVGEETFKVIFSAHSVPIFALDYGDPYIDQIFDNSKLIAEQLGLTAD